MKPNFLFFVIVGAIGFLVARMFVRNKEETELTGHMKAQEQLQRIKNISGAVVNNAAPAFALIGNMPQTTESRDPIGATATSPQRLQIPARVSSI